MDEDVYEDLNDGFIQDDDSDDEDEDKLEMFNIVGLQKVASSEDVSENDWPNSGHENFYHFCGVIGGEKRLRPEEREHEVLTGLYDALHYCETNVGVWGSC